jgi:zinc protease
VPKEKLDEMMALEADRMRHLNVAPQEFAQEIKVVMEERRMRTDDNPQSKLFEQMNAVAFQAHPYRRPIIGWMNDLETMTAADAKAWYDTWYVPNNAYVVITGDVDHKAVFAQAEKYYGPLEARPLPVRRQQIEPRQEGPRCVTVKAPAELPILIMGYKAPVIRDIERDSDPYALEMLASILDGHDAARFNKKLVREDKVALSVGIDYDDTARGPGMLYLHGTPRKARQSPTSKRHCALKSPACKKTESASRNSNAPRRNYLPGRFTSLTPCSVRPWKSARSNRPVCLTSKSIACSKSCKK